MPPYKRENGQWTTDFWGPDVKNPGGRRRYRLSLGPEVRTKREAEAAEREERVRVDREAKEAREALARAPSSPSPTGSGPDPLYPLSGFARLWLDTVIKVDRKPTVYRLYESMIRNWLIPFFGERRCITSIGRADVQALKAWAVERTELAKPTDHLGRKRPMHGRKRSPKTINEVLCVLSSMLGYAVKDGYLDRNVCLGVDRLLLPPQEFAFYTRTQSDAWLHACARLEPAWFPLFLAGFRTGLREGELFALRWDDVDFTTLRIYVRRSLARGAAFDPDGRRLPSAYIETLPKSNQARVVEMSPELATVLRGYRHARGALVFAAEDGHHLTRDMLIYPWARVTRASGLPPIRPHDMRHSFASQLVMAGIPLIEVKALLGHSTIRMTERYAHLAPTGRASVVAALDSGVLDTSPQPHAPPIRRSARNSSSNVVGPAGFEPVNATAKKGR